MRAAARFTLWVMPFVFGHCTPRESGPPTAQAPSSSASAPRKREGPIRIEVLDAAGEPPVYVLRGSPRGPEKLVFLHGMCGHPLGYAQSFQHSAAKVGTLVAPQADVPCDGSGARWSKELAALDARVAQAFRALGHEEPLLDVIAIGYSQGATRAESLARQYPERYTRLILIGGPYVANPRGLETLRALIAMAGERDRLDLMQQSARALRSIDVPATFLVIPEATHGSMGPHPERTMEEAFSWLSASQRPRAGSAPATSPDAGRTGDRP